MISVKIYAFIFSMWILILIGGGLMVIFIGPISFPVDIDPKTYSKAQDLLVLKKKNSGFVQSSVHQH